MEDDFKNTYRHLDDIFFSLNNQEFSHYTAEIYPRKLTLTQTNTNSNNCPFLHLYISVVHGKLCD